MRRLLSIVAIMFLFLARTEGAAPIFHAIVALKWLDVFEHYSDDDRRAFILGTLFPDIRYPAQIHRNITHEKNITIDDILKTKDPFYKGLRLHSYVDVIRTRFVYENDILKNIQAVPVDPILFLKLVEDQILFYKYGEKYFSPIRVDLRSINKNELRYNIPYSTVRKWHEFLMLCFEYPPSMRMQILLEHPKKYMHSYNQKTLKELVKYLPQYQNNQKLVAYTNEIIEHFETIFKEKNSTRNNPISSWDYFQETLSEIKTFFLKLFH